MKIFYLLNNIVVSIVLMLVGLTDSYAEVKEPARVIAGWVENVKIEKQDFKVKAKLDTGAMTSSIHALNIETYKKDNQRFVKFDLPLTDKYGELRLMAVEKPRSRKVKIKNHNGKHDNRYVVELDVCFNGLNYPVQFTLVDRSQFNYNILLGRRFLSRVAIIDPLHSFLTSATCK